MAELILHDNKLEELLIATLLKGDKEISERLIGIVDKTFFKNPYWLEIFERIYTLLKQKSKIFSYTELSVDQTLSESSRVVLEGLSSEIIKTNSELNSILEQIQFILKKRKLFEINQATSNFLVKGGSLQETSKKLSDLVYQFNTSSSSSVEESLFRITEDHNNKLLELILSGGTQRYIPTGFDEFDRRNKGLPRGGFSCISATTGGGKCLIGNSIVLTSCGPKTLKELWEQSSGEIDEEGFNKLIEEIYVYTNEYRKKRITHTYKTRGKTIKISFSDGTTIQGLAEHKIWILDEANSPVFKRLDEICEGDKTFKFDPLEILKVLTK